MNDPKAANVAGVRRQMRELVDGTIEVKVHIQPFDRADFLRLFPEIDMPVALTPLNPKAKYPDQVSDHSRDERAATAKPSNWAAMLCKEWGFWRWLTVEHGPVWEQYCEPVGKAPSVWEQDEIDAAEDAAKHCIYEIVDIDSRALLDHDAKALTRFEALIRVPYRRWLSEQDE